jgi:hypothetical protein
MYPPERIVCLTEETTETLYLLGEQHRIVGIRVILCGHRRRARRSRVFQHSFLPTSRKSWLSNLTWF